MRVIVLIKANADSEAGVMPSEELLAAMGKFNEELVNAGVMLDGEGLHPSSKAKRVKFTGVTGLLRMVHLPKRENSLLGSGSGA
jgi:hypothetical protein